MKAVRKGQAFETSDFGKLKDPILAQHGSQDAAQEGSKIDQTSVKKRFVFEFVLGPLLGSLRDPKNY